MFQEYDVIVVKKNMPSTNISIGDRGTILLIFNEPNLPTAYEVEFSDEKGNSLAIMTLTEEEVKEYCTKWLDVN